MIEDTAEELPSLFTYLWRFIRNPLVEIKTLPKIKWPTLVAFQFCLSLASVIISNLLAPFAISLTNVIISLVIAMVATGLVSLFFYYFFLILYEKEISFIKVFTLILFAHIPFAIFHLATYFFPPADLIGLGISAMLMTVGLVENFGIPKKLAIRLMIALYSIFFVYWGVQLIARQSYRKSTIPQDLDLIEKEVQDFIEN
jgi:hypothetical protein